MELEVGSKTNPGRRRQNNEDAISARVPADPELRERKGALFLVADGVGGSEGGEVASSEAIRWVVKSYYESNSQDVIQSLSQAIVKANEEIFSRSQEDLILEDMATTIVAAVIRGEQLWIANVGDSRAYLIRRNSIKQITTDHSWTNDQIQAGFLTESQAKQSPYRSAITRGLGKNRTVEVDTFSPKKLHAGNVLVLCSDGLSDLVHDDEIHQFASSVTPGEAVETLVGLANLRGGPDNISVLVVRVYGAIESAPKKRHRRMIILLVLLTLSLIAFITWLFYNKHLWL